MLDHEKREWKQLQKKLDSLVKKTEEIDDDDDWISGQAKLAEQQRKVHELSLMVKAIEEFNNNIEQFKKV